MAISSLKQIDLRLESAMSKSSALQPGGGTTAGEANFGEALVRAGASIVEPEKEAAAAVSQFEDGRRNIHETLLAIEKADISFKYMMNIRNKLLDAYKEVMQMGA